VPNLDTTWVERFRDRIASQDDVKGVVELFAQFTLLEGDWITRQSGSGGKEITAEGQAEWAATKEMLQKDISSYGYDISYWQAESIAAITLTIIAMPSLTRLMKEVILEYVTAQSRDENVRQVGKFIRVIVDAEEEG